LSNDSNTPPEDVIRTFERAIIDADVSRMAECIGELHSRWNTLSSTMQSDVLKLEAIFLSILNARVRHRSEE
jgi:hypothetical protein